MKTKTAARLFGAIVSLNGLVCAVMAIYSSNWSIAEKWGWAGPEVALWAIMFVLSQALIGGLL